MPARAIAVRTLVLRVLLVLGVAGTQPAVGIAQQGAGDVAPGAELALGAIEFPVTAATAEVRRQFELGVLALHSFWYEEALEHFRRARQIEPGFAMAYWGEALAHDHPFWGMQDSTAARQVLAEPPSAPRASTASMPPIRMRLTWRRLSA